jgi:hypothetical protein
VLAFTAQWVQSWQHASAMGWACLERAAQLYDPRHMRNLWLADLKKLTVDYLRSPAFLELVRFQMIAASRASRFTSRFPHD